MQQMHQLVAAQHLLCQLLRCRYMFCGVTCSPCSKESCCRKFIFFGYLLLVLPCDLLASTTVHATHCGSKGTVLQQFRNCYFSLGVPPRIWDLASEEFIFQASSERNRGRSSKMHKFIYKWNNLKRETKGKDLLHHCFE